jgi:hypothetical protein
MHTGIYPGNQILFPGQPLHLPNAQGNKAGKGRQAEQQKQERKKTPTSHGNASSNVGKDR